MIKELRVLDKNGKVGILMYDRPYGDGGGSVLVMSVKDNRIFEDGTPSQGKLMIGDGGLDIDNRDGANVAALGVDVVNGYFWLQKGNRSPDNEFHIDTGNPKYSKTHCPCQRVE